MNKKISNSHMAVLSMIIILLIACSTQFSGTASSQQVPSTGDTAGSPVIQGLEGLQGFKSGHNQLSLAIIPLSRQNSQMTFQVIGFAVSSPESGQAVVYSLETPLPGIIDPSRNTMQIDISNIDTAIGTSGYIDSSGIYDTIRTDPKVVVIDIDMSYQGKQGSQTIFMVNAIDIIPPDGRMQTYSMQQPTQLIIDTQDNRVAMVAFPEMVSTLGSYYGATYAQVEPVIYTQPVPVLAPVFVPYIRPIPIYVTGFVSFRSFHFGSGFHTFYARDRITHHDRFTKSDRFPVRQPKNEFANSARNSLVAGQRKGEFTKQRNLGTGIKGGIGGYRGGVKASTGRRAGGGRRR